MKDKKAIIRKDTNGMPIEILDIKSLSVEDFLKYQKICKVAQEESLKEEKNKNDLLEQRLSQLEKDLYNVKLELAYNRGDITQEEYESGVK